MPSGRTHAFITTLTAAGLFGYAYSTGTPQPAAIALAGGCLAGLILTPDLDVNGGVRSHTIVKREAGRLLAAAWRAIWLPYSRLLPHRHWLSHAPLVSTFLRVGYLSLIAWLLLLVTGNPWPWDELPGWWRFALAGLVVSDCLHWAADSSLTHSRKLRRKTRMLGL